MNLEDLKNPFDPQDIEWRIGMSGLNGGGKVWAKALAYLTNRAIQNRLDEVCGPENWRNEFKEWNVGGKPGVLCGISIKVPADLSPPRTMQWSSEWITKWDGAENTDIEAVKGGLSDAMKRAAVQWSVGRYLYNLDETWVETSMEKRSGWKYAKTKDDKAFWWKEPDLPSWALPGPSGRPEVVECISYEEGKFLLTLIRDCGAEEVRFLSWASKAAKFPVDSVSRLPKSLYEKAKRMLEAEGAKA